jgi:acyl carrier protein
MTATDPQTTALEARLLALAAHRFGKSVAGLAPSDDVFDKLGIDSMQAMELLTEIEAAFGVEIPDYELQGVTTFAGIAALVRRRLG